MLQGMFEPRIPVNFMVYFGFAIMFSALLFLIIEEFTAAVKAKKEPLSAMIDFSKDVAVNDLCKIDEDRFLRNVSTLLQKGCYELKFGQDIVGNVIRCTHVSYERAFFIISFNDSEAAVSARELFKSKKISLKAFPFTAYIHGSDGNSTCVITGVRSMFLS